MADEVDQSALVNEFCGLTGAPEELATQYLQANGWNLSAATSSFFQDDDEQRAETTAQPGTGAAPADESYTGPRTLDGRPAPQSASSSRRPAASRASQPKKKGIATLGSMGASQAHDDHDDDSDDGMNDDDDDGRGNLFAGGEKSGLAVQDPKQDGGTRKLLDDIFNKAKSNTRRPEAEAPEPGPSTSRFTGAGQTLGGEGQESMSIPDPAGSRPADVEPQRRVLHIWEDGFSIDDGELMRYDDPAHTADLNLIRQGRAPLHLMNVPYNTPVDVRLMQHRGPYVAQPKQYKPFGGEGRRLGSPVPGAGEGSGSIDAAASVATTAASGPSGASGSAPVIDDSQPTIMLRIQLPDGTRLPARFNTTSTVGDVYSFINAANPDLRSRQYVIATTFPNKEHTDNELTLGDMAEFKKGGTAVVKWKT